MTPVDLIPDPERLKEVFTLAAGPAFFLGAVTGLVSILMGRIGSVTDELRADDASTEGGTAHRENLLVRLRLLHQSSKLALASGVSTAVLLALSFAGAFFKLQHVYGSGLLFFVASALVGFSIFRFYQEVRLALADMSRFERAPRHAAATRRDQPPKPPT